MAVTDQLRTNARSRPAVITAVVSIVGYALVFGAFGGLLPLPDISNDAVILLSDAIAVVNAAALTAKLHDEYRTHRKSNGTTEDMGAFIRRLGNDAILDLLRADPACAEYLKKSFPAPFMPQTHEGVFVTVGESD